jgi:hypothetical protein
MGFSSSWLAVRGKASDDVLAELGLVETSLREWMPESEIVSTTAPAGWFVVFFNEASPGALKPETLKRLSATAELVTCQIEEHAMVSAASEWRDAKELWYVAHDAEDGLTNLESTGELPTGFADVRDRQQSKQQTSSDIDYIFDVPIELAASIVGFRHDDSFDGAASEPFTVLAVKR